MFREGGQVVKNIFCEKSDSICGSFLNECLKGKISHQRVSQDLPFYQGSVLIRINLVLMYHQRKTSDNMQICGLVHFEVC